MTNEEILRICRKRFPKAYLIKNKIVLALVSHSGQYCIDSSESGPLFRKESAIKRYIKEGEEDIYSKIRQEQVMIVIVVLLLAYLMLVTLMSIGDFIILLII